MMFKCLLSLCLPCGKSCKPGQGGSPTPSLVQVASIVHSFNERQNILLRKTFLFNFYFLEKSLK